MKIESLQKQIAAIESRMGSGKIATTDNAGRRAWITGSGIHFYYEVMKLGRDEGHPLTFAELPEHLRDLVTLWSRAEIDRGEHGALSVWNRNISRRLLGLPVDEGYNVN